MKQPTAEWIVVANATRARVLSRVPGKPMQLEHVFLHPESRARELWRHGKAGRELGASGTGAATYLQRTDEHQKERERFAAEITEWLETQAQQGAFESLAIVAASPFLGIVRHSLGRACASRLVRVRDLDLSHVGPAEIEARLDDALALAASTEGPFMGQETAR